jgi:predicted PurR-regulated permease PerM
LVNELHVTIIFPCQVNAHAFHSFRTSQFQAGFVFFKLRRAEASKDSPRPSLVRLVLIVAGTVIFLAAMRKATQLVNLFLLGFLITLLALPLMHSLTARGFSGLAAYLFTLLAILGVAASVLLIAVFSLGSAATNVPADLGRFRVQTDTIAAIASNQPNRSLLAEQGMTNLLRPLQIDSG